MKKTLILTIGLALGWSTINVLAQPCGGPGGRGPFRHGAQGFPPPVAAVLDADANGVLSGDEVSQAGNHLLALDQNQDHQLTAEELCARRGPDGQGCPQGKQCQRRGAAQCGQPVLLRLFDADENGVLSEAECANAPAILGALDTNKDGQIAREEIRALAGCGRGRGCAREV